MSNVTRHSVYLIAAYFLTAGLNYAFGVSLSWFFEPAYYGVLGVAQSLLLLLALVVGSGFAWTVAYEFASAGVTQETRQHFRSAWLANLFLAAGLCLLVWLFYVTGLLDLGSSYSRLVPLIGLTVILLAMRAVSNGALRGLYRFGHLASNLVLETLIKSILGLGLVLLGLGVEGVLWGFVAGAGLSLLHSLWSVRDKHLFSGQGWMKTEVVRRSLPLFIGLMGIAFMLNLDVFGLKLLAPDHLADEMTGFYQAAVILARTPVYLAQALTLVLFSYVAGVHVAPERRVYKVRESSKSALLSWFRYLLPIGLLLILAPGGVMRIFFPDIYQQSTLELQIAASGGLLLALVTLLIGVLQAQGRTREPAYLAGLAAICQVVALFVLVPRLGAIGAALSLVFAGVVALAGLIWLLTPVIILPINRLSIRKLFVAGAYELIPHIFLAGGLLILPHHTWYFALLKLFSLTLLYGLMLLFRQVRRGKQAHPKLALVSMLRQVMSGR
jgi:O-antigen/teichoic acid export membrane protein